MGMGSVVLSGERGKVRGGGESFELEDEEDEDEEGKKSESKVGWFCVVRRVEKSE